MKVGKWLTLEKGKEKKEAYLQKMYKKTISGTIKINYVKMSGQNLPRLPFSWTVRTR